MSLIKKFFREEDGQDMVEYGLVISLVVLAAAVGLGTFSSSITGALSNLGTAISNNL